MRGRQHPTRVQPGGKRIIRPITGCPCLRSAGKARPPHCRSSAGSANGRCVSRPRSRGGDYGVVIGVALSALCSAKAGALHFRVVSVIMPLPSSLMTGCIWADTRTRSFSFRCPLYHTLAVRSAKREQCGSPHGLTMVSHFAASSAAMSSCRELTARWTAQAAASGKPARANASLCRIRGQSRIAIRSMQV